VISVDCLRVHRLNSPAKTFLLVFSVLLGLGTVFLRCGFLFLSVVRPAPVRFHRSFSTVRQVFFSPAQERAPGIFHVLCVPHESPSPLPVWCSARSCVRHFGSSVRAASQSTWCCSFFFSLLARSCFLFDLSMCAVGKSKICEQRPCLQLLSSKSRP
jgi:hypothetical protein